MNKLITTLAKSLAILGGVVLVALVALTCASVVGRIINTMGHSAVSKEQLGAFGELLRSFGPINGDYELVESGIAFAIFLFLPWCQLKRGHATVDIFTANLPRIANRFLQLLWEVVFMAVIWLITWRLFVGMSDKMRYAETTFLLQMPIWWAYAVCAVAALLASVVALYSVVLHVRDMRVSGTTAESEQGSPT